MVAMELSTTYSVGNGLADGGYRNDVNIPFTAKGTSGEKNIYYRINGGQPYTLGLSAGSGVQQKNVTVALSEMRGGHERGGSLCAARELRRGERDTTT